jgi:methionyl-tRNA formyltransferase
MRVAAIGRGRILLDTIAALVASGHEVPLIATCPENSESDLAPDTWPQTARDLNADHVDGVLSIDRLRRMKCDLGVSVNWVSRIGSDARNAFSHGILNAHGGDLPRYRGNAPFAWALLNGERTAGITIHSMDDGLDSGPIFCKRLVAITPDTYIGDLYRALAAQVPRMFADVVQGIEQGTLHGEPQLGVPLRCYARTPADGAIDWRLPAAYLARLVRASAEPFTGAFTSYRGERVTVWRADTIASPEAFCAVPGQVLDSDSVGIVVATGDGVLRVTEMETAGGRGAPAAWFRSTRGRLG